MAENTTAIALSALSVILASAAWGSVSQRNHSTGPVSDIKHEADGLFASIPNQFSSLHGSGNIFNEAHCRKLFMRSNYL